MNAHLRDLACVQAIKIDVTQDRERMRSLSERPPADGRIRYEAQLPAGRYRLTVALECEDLSRVSVLSRPLDLQDDDLQVPINVTKTCACES